MLVRAGTFGWIAGMRLTAVPSRFCRITRISNGLKFMPRPVATAKLKPSVQWSLWEARTLPTQRSDSTAKRQSCRLSSNLVVTRTLSALVTSVRVFYGISRRSCTAFRKRRTTKKRLIILPASNNHCSLTAGWACSAFGYGFFQSNGLN